MVISFKFGEKYDYCRGQINLYLRKEIEMKKNRSFRYYSTSAKSFLIETDPK